MASATEAMAAQEIPQFSCSDGKKWVTYKNSDALLPPKPGLEIYVGTTFAVMAAYALLLMISIRYIKIVVIPAIILVFIGALWGKFWVKGRSQYRSNRTAKLGSHSGKAQRLLPMVQISYCLLAFAVVADMSNGQQSGNFAISHFLLFFSFALGALAMMMATLPIETSPGVAQAQQALHRTFTVILVITVHTLAAEWMEKDMVLVCMPGLISALVWFTVNFDHCGCTLSVNKVTSRRSIVIVLTAAATLVVVYLASKSAYENEILANYWYTRILWPCTLSGVLSYFSVWMIRQWPGNTDGAKVLIQLLEFSANICFGISTMILTINLHTNLAADVTRLGQWVLPKAALTLYFKLACYSVMCCLFAYKSVLNGDLRTIIHEVVLPICAAELYDLYKYRKVNADSQP